MAAPDFTTLKATQHIMDTLAQQLGVAFKPEKDEGLEEPTQALEFLGIWLDLAANPITASPPQDKRK